MKETGWAWTSPEPMHPNMIDATVAQYHAHGQYWIGQLGAPAISVLEWKERELQRWNDRKETT